MSIENRPNLVDPVRDPETSIVTQRAVDELLIAENKAAENKNTNWDTFKEFVANYPDTRSNPELIIQISRQLKNSPEAFNKLIESLAYSINPNENASNLKEQNKIIDMEAYRDNREAKAS